MYRLVLLLATTTVTRQLGSEMNQVAGPNAMHDISRSSHTKASLKLCARARIGRVEFRRIRTHRSGTEWRGCLGNTRDPRVVNFKNNNEWPPFSKSAELFVFMFYILLETIRRKQLSPAYGRA